LKMRMQSLIFQSYCELAVVNLLRSTDFVKRMELAENITHLDKKG